MYVSDFHWLGIGNGAVSLAFRVGSVGGGMGMGAHSRVGVLMYRNGMPMSRFGFDFFVEVII